MKFFATEIENDSKMFCNQNRNRFLQPKPKAVRHCKLDPSQIHIDIMKGGALKPTHLDYETLRRMGVGGEAAQNSTYFFSLRGGAAAFFIT